MSSVKATMANVTIKFGLVSFPVDLVSAVKSKQAKAKGASRTMICPTCEIVDSLQPLRQRYLCTHSPGHGPFGQGDASYAIEVDGKLTPLPAVTTSEEPAAEAQPERGAAELTVHPAADVEAHTWPSGNIYWLRPRGNEAHYGLVLELAADPSIALICEITNKGATLLYRLVAHGGALALTELIRPEMLQGLDEMPDVSFDEKLLGMTRSLVDSMSEPFEPAAWADRRKARLEALAAQVKQLESAPTATPAADTASDLLELLRRSVDAAAA